MKNNELREKRNALQMTQSQLAQALGVNLTTISRWERGARPIPAYVSLALQTLERQSQETHLEKTASPENLPNDLIGIHKGRHIQLTGPWVSLMKTTKMFHFNEAAFEALGRPIALVLLFDMENQAVGFMPSTLATKYAYEVKKMKTHSAYRISGKAFSIRYEIDTSITRTFPVESLENVIIDDGKKQKVLAFYINEPPKNKDQHKFETFKGKSSTVQFIRVTFRKEKAIGLNRRAYEALGKPGWLIPKWDPLRREILLIPSKGEDVRAYKVREETGSWKITADAIMRQAGIKLKRAQVFKGWMRDDTLVFKVDLGTPMKGKGKKLITAGRPLNTFTLSLEEFNSRGIKEVQSYFAKKLEYPPGWHLAKRLGIGRATLYRYLDRLNLPSLKAFCELAISKSETA